LQTNSELKVEPINWLARIQVFNNDDNDDDDDCDIDSAWTHTHLIFINPDDEASCSESITNPEDGRP